MRITFGVSSFGAREKTGVGRDELLCSPSRAPLSKVLVSGAVAVLEEGGGGELPTAASRGSAFPPSGRATLVQHSALSKRLRTSECALGRCSAAAQGGPHRARFHVVTLIAAASRAACGAVRVAAAARDCIAVHRAGAPNGPSHEVVEGVGWRAWFLISGGHHLLTRHCHHRHATAHMCSSSQRAPFRSTAFCVRNPTEWSCV